MSADETNTDQGQQLDPSQKARVDLLSPNPFADVILDVGVEGKRVYASRWLLVDASEVFCKMFASHHVGKEEDVEDDDGDKEQEEEGNDGEEQEEEEQQEDGISIVKLRDISLESLLEFMYWAMPSTRSPVTAGSAEILLPFADKYHVTKLRDECEAVLIGELQSAKNNEKCLKNLLLAQNYTIPSLYNVCVNQLSHVPLGDLKQLRDFAELSVATSADIMACRLQLMETVAKQEADTKSTSECALCCPHDKVTLLVENHPLSLSRMQLMVASPVFKAMLDSSFKEGRNNEVVLPEKGLDAVKFLVKYVASGFTTPIDDDLLEPIVALADEYLITRLRNDCEAFMMERIEKASGDEVLLYLYLAQTHNIANVREESETFLSAMNHQELSACPNYNRPDLGKILSSRVEQLEKKLANFTEQVKSKWNEFLRGVDTASATTCGNNHPQGGCPAGMNNGCDRNRLCGLLTIITSARGTGEQVAPYIKQLLEDDLQV